MTMHLTARFYVPAPVVMPALISMRPMVFICHQNADPENVRAQIDAIDNPEGEQVCWWFPTDQ